MTMTLEYYLQNVYPKKCKAQRAPTIRAEITSKEDFEIKDLEESEKSSPTSNPINIPIIKNKGEGVACFYNPQQIETYIVDFEYYINGFRNKAAREGKKCDFVLYSSKDCLFIIVNELKNRGKRYIRQDDAIEQLNASIEKLCQDESFLSQFKHKIRLFSYRLTAPDSQNKSTSLVGQNAGRFNQPALVAKNISSHVPDHRGFTFEQRMYPEVYELPPEED